jgi:uncharacterized protein (TIGR03118 family)
MAAIRPRANLDAGPRSGWRRWWARRLGAFAAIAVLGLTGGASVAGAAGNGNAFRQRDLVSDIPGRAQITDPDLVNPWGLAAGPTTPLWAADNGTDVSTLYSGGVNGSPPVKAPLVVSIPGGAPTGLVFNPTSGFVVHRDQASAPAAFIFDSEAGKIVAWSPKVPPMTEAQVEVSTPNAVYKGLAIADSPRGTLLYAANFHAAKIDVFDDTFSSVTLPGSFTDPNLPAGYAPFNVQALGTNVYVTYAKQDEQAKDDVAGPGNGFVDVYDTSGHLLRRLVSRGQLNSPWGLVIAPDGFGRFGGDLLVGNFGDGAINAYDRSTGDFQGQLRDQDGNPIRIDGLWTLRFGNGVFGTPSTLIFSAGINDEQHGLLGELIANGG